MSIITKEKFDKQLELLEEKYGHQSNIGLFGPTSIIWRITRETFLLFDSGTILLSQKTNPLISKALFEHSLLKTDPWKRFNNTLDGMAHLIFGDLKTVLETSKRIYKIHDKISGDGYQANQEDLLFWIASVTLYTHVLFYERYIKELTKNEKSKLYEEFKILLCCFGLTDENMPTTWTGFRVFVFNGILGTDKLASQQTIDLANKYLNYKIVKWITICNLPEHINRYYGFKLDDPERLFVKLLMFFMSKTLWILPKQIRYLPLYNHAIKRISSSS